MSRESIAVVIGAVLTVLLQLIVAPNIAIFSIMPNFMLAYVLVVAIARPADSTLVLAFVMGIMYDLLAYGPVGSMALLMVLAAFLASRVFMILDNDTFVMPFVIIVVSLLSVELLYTAFLVGLGFASSVADAMIYRTLPCFLYDCLLALIMYPLMSRFLSSTASASSTGAGKGMPTTNPMLSTDTRRSVTKKKRYR